jgi:tagatose 1,6-diphosphate aldolase
VNSPLALGSELPGFDFLDPGPLRHGDLELRLKDVCPSIASQVPTYRFEMRRQPGFTKVGKIEFRVGATTEIQLYSGNIGYRVDQSHRGNRYAARSCQLLADLAKRHGFRELWITCDTDNTASRRTCEAIGAEFISVVPVPETHPYYRAGSRAKCRFLWRLE